MCPDAEIKLRERENLLHPFEVAESHTSKRPKADFKKCVKEYRRPTVGKQEINPGEVRPPNILCRTVDYLIDRICCESTRWSEVYDFVFDRLRAVRQDLVVQEACGPEVVSILERAVRFHVYSDYRLCMEHTRVFDEKINSQHTQECLKRLLNMYMGVAEHHHYHDNREEIETIYLLFNLGDLHAVTHYYSLQEHLRQSTDVKIAYQMSLAYLCNNWARLVHLMKKLKSPVYMCAVHRHLPTIQRNAMFTMNTAFSSKNLKFPLSKLTELLLLNTDTESQELCEQFGITVEGSHALFQKANFRPLEKIARSHCDFINRNLKEYTVPEILHGVRKPYHRNGLLQSDEKLSIPTQSSLAQVEDPTLHVHNVIVTHGVSEFSQGEISERQLSQNFAEKCQT